MGNLLDGCCSSKRAQDQLEEEEDFNKELSAGIEKEEAPLAPPTPANEWDAAMATHLKEALKEIKEEKDLAVFQNLMLIFKTARQWSHTRFEKEKTVLITSRRNACKTEDEAMFMQSA